MNASRNGHLEVVKLLIKNGANVSGQNTCVSVSSILVVASSYTTYSSFGKDAMMYAKEQNHFKITQFLSDEWLEPFSHNAYVN